MTKSSEEAEKALRPLGITIAIATALSAIAWVHGYFSARSLYPLRDVWFHVVSFLLPIVSIALGTWVFLHPVWWRRLLGIIVLLPSGALWLLYLLLASHAFRIH